MNNYCAKCGYAMGPENAFCGKCGEAMNPSYATTSQLVTRSVTPSAYDKYAPVPALRSRWPKRLAIAAVVVFGIPFAIGFVNNFAPAFTKHYATASHAQPSNAEPSREAGAGAASVPSVFAIGQTVRVGYWTYKVNSYRWMTGVMDPIFAGKVETPDGQFLAINLTVENEDKSPSILPSLSLIDAQGRESQESSAGAMRDEVFGPLKSLNPGVESTGWVVFDVAPHHSYGLQLNGGYESGKHAYVVVGESSQNAESTGQNVDLPGLVPAQRVAQSDPPAPQTVAPYTVINGQDIRSDMPALCSQPGNDGRFPSACIVQPVSEPQQ
jgi:hypothetical protein